jgi:DNA polymerase-3 subunit epsilon
MNSLTPVAESVEELERCASILEASGDYRILRRLRLTTADRPPATVGIRRGVFVDTETTGLDPDTDEILELAMLAFDYSVNCE